MKTSMQQLYEDVLDLRARVQLVIQRETECVQKEAKLSALADLAYAMHSLEKLFDDSRKDAKRLKSLIERVACLYWMKRSNTDPIRTPWVTATPNLRQIASCPRKTREPEHFKALMDHLGIQEWVWDREEELVRPHFPGWMSYLSERAEQGKPLPPGIDLDKTYPQYTLRLRPKKGVNEAAE